MAGSRSDRGLFPRRYDPFSVSSKARRIVRGYYGTGGRYLSSVAMSWGEILVDDLSDGLASMVKHVPQTHGRVMTRHSEPRKGLRLEMLGTMPGRGCRIHCRVCMRPELSPGDPEQRVFSANDASPKWNNPSERQGWALKQKGQSAAYIQSNVCATPPLLDFSSSRSQLTVVAEP